MITTMKTSLSRKFKNEISFYSINLMEIIGAESLPNLNTIRTASPLKPSFSPVSSNSPDILSAAVLHKRPQQKRVRFALKLESVEEDSVPSSRDISPSFVSKSNRRIIDPWRQDGPLYGSYVEYLDKQDSLTSNEFQTRRTPPSPIEPGAEPPTYTHTFVIQSKSPEIVINSITVSTPPVHLPRILHQTRKTNKQPLPTLDSNVKQQLTLSTAPRIIHTKKVTHISNPKPHYTSVHTTLKRTESNLPPTNGLHVNNKLTRSENPFGAKLMNDHMQQKKITEVITRPGPGVNNQINHFSERSILPNYSAKPRGHNRSLWTNDEVNTNAPYFFQNPDNDHFPQPIIHSNR
jgi:hypothetical protein